MPREKISLRGVERLPSRLLGAHVMDRAHDRSGERGRGGHRQSPSEKIGRSAGWCRPGVEELGQAEIQELGVAVPGDHDVVRLDIAVEDARLVGFGQAFGDLESDVHRTEQIELAVGDEPRNGPAVDVFHGDERRPAILVDVVDLGDGRMGEGCGGPGFGQKTRPPVGVGHELGSQNLDGHGPTQPRIPGEIDDAHSASADQALDPIVLQRPADQGIRHGHALNLSYHRPPLWSIGQQDSLGRAVRPDKHFRLVFFRASER